MEKPDLARFTSIFRRIAHYATQNSDKSDSNRSLPRYDPIFPTDSEALETPRDLAFCAHAILSPDEAFVIEDASRDVRFHDNPMVVSEPSIRFYAGIALRSPTDQMPLGTLCAISPRAMSVSADVIEQLKILAHQVERLLALRRTNIDLQDRTALLEKARTIAEDASAAKSRFLATISHDKRTPLNGLIGTLGMLDETLDSEQQCGFARTAESCARVLLQLVNDTLDLSQIESGTIELGNEPFSPSRVIEETARVVRATLNGKPVELNVNIDTTTARFLMGDLVRCKQIILNLLSNSAKFTETGEIGIESKIENGDWVITVTDTGPGISSEDLVSIFDPYVQSESGITSKSKGAGLGLNICKRLCTLMNGDISVKSELGKGSTFTARMRLPVALENIEAVSPKSFELPPLNILIAEDDRISREILSARLRKAGCSVTAVTVGDEAFQELVRRGPEFDVAILDYNMPGMTGPEVAEKYRQIESRDFRLPVIALTARGFESDRETCISAGMDIMLTKPLAKDQLEEILNDMIVSNLINPAAQCV